MESASCNISSSDDAAAAAPVCSTAGSSASSSSRSPSSLRLPDHAATALSAARGTARLTLVVSPSACVSTCRMCPKCGRRQASTTASDSRSEARRSIASS
eukprot:6590933-Prymnesium_polylepis.1